MYDMIHGGKPTSSRSRILPILAGYLPAAARPATSVDGRMDVPRSHNYPCDHRHRAMSPVHVGAGKLAILLHREGQYSAAPSHSVPLHWVLYV